MFHSSHVLVARLKYTESSSAFLVRSAKHLFHESGHQAPMAAWMSYHVLDFLQLQLNVRWFTLCISNVLVAARILLAECSTACKIAVRPSIRAAKSSEAAAVMSLHTRPKFCIEHANINTVRPLRTARASISASASKSRATIVFFCAITANIKEFHPRSVIESGSALLQRSLSTISSMSPSNSQSFDSALATVQSSSAPQASGWHVFGNRDGHPKQGCMPKIDELHKLSKSVDPSALKIEIKSSWTSCSKLVPASNSGKGRTLRTGKRSSSLAMCWYMLPHSSRTGSSLCSEIWHQRRACRSHSPIARSLLGERRTINAHLFWRTFRM